MARFVVKNQQQKDMCYDEIALCNQNIDIIIGSIVNIIGKVYASHRENKKGYFPLVLF